MSTTDRQGVIATVGAVDVVREGAVLTLRSGRVKLNLSDQDAKALALAILTPPDDWRRSVLWATFDSQIEAVFGMDPDDRGPAMLALQRMVAPMNAMGMLSGGDDVSAVRAFVAAMAGEGEWPAGMPSLPTYDELEGTEDADD